MAIIILKNKDGTLRHQVKVRDAGGKWFPTPCFEKREDALREEARLITLKRKGMRVISEDARTVTVDEYWEVWKIENRAKVSDGWKISQDQMYRDYVKPVIAELRIIEVGPPEIGRCLNRAQELGLSEQTRKHIYSLLRTMFNDAVEYYEMITVNPVKAKFHRPKVPKGKRKFLLPAQAWQLLEAAEKHRYLGPAIWVQTLSAMRPEAMQGLKWSGVQWELDQILICRAWKQKVGLMEEFPKNDAWEYVPMPPALKGYLWNQWLKVKDPDAFVCQGIKGGMLSYNTYLGALKLLCAKIGLPVITPHELRHTCTEIYMRAGASAEDIRRLLNHASLSATKTYIHRTDERLGKIALNVGGEPKEKAMFQTMFQSWNKEAEVMDEKDLDKMH